MRQFARLLQSALVLALLALSALAEAQTCSIPGQAGTQTINAQPNTFFPGSNSPAAGATSIIVAAGAGVNRNIAAGDLLLIIQMQGADINSTDTNAYGVGTTAAGVTNTVAFGATGYAGGVNGTNFLAGNYEWAVATGGGATFGAGGTINLSAPLTRAYATRAGSTTQGKQSWQVVRVPQFANVTLNGGLTVQPWDGTDGGLLVIDATGDINMGGQTITGTGRGFRGAGAVNVDANTTCTNAFNTTGCQQYVSTIAAALGGSKGEGIVGTPARIYTGDPAGSGAGTVTAGTADGYIVGEAARGAPGNAGGGGNQHNAGGGGGANGGAGGKGGNTWNGSTAGFAGLQLGGFGGAPSASSATRWLLGGAGGAGDVGGNGSASPDGSGGAAGAMVILRASRITGGGTINLNGAPGRGAGATDASGGGGSGGTMVIAVGAGGLNGAYTINANGGAGGTYSVAGVEQDGPGGGGGGGLLIHNVATGTATFNAAGGAAGGSSTTAGCAPNCGAAVGSATSGAAGYAITSPGVQVGYECLPNLAVTKATSTPIVTSSTGAQATYTIVITNTGGGARFVNVLDTALPPGWTRAATAPTYAYSPAQPLAAGVLSSGGETIAIATSSTWAVQPAPATVPAAGSNTLTWSAFAVAPITGGVPGKVTITFAATIPDTATVGTYHNGAGATFLDPTRAAASTRTVAPLTNISANRTSTAYSANTTYNSYNGLTTTVSVSGSHYNGSQTGPTFEDVDLVPDFSITKTASASATPGSTFSYVITPRNNGRPIGSQTFTTSQATDVTTANVPTALGSNPVTVTDTLPAGLTLTTAFTGTGWTCTGSGTSTVVCTLANANAYPVAANTPFPTISGIASVTATCNASVTPLTNTVQISNPQDESVTGNNTATAVTSVTCVSTNLQVTKTNAVTSIPAGSSTVYTITVSNTGASANNSVLKDVASAGLNCTAVTCSGVTNGAVCPTVGAGAGQLSIANLLGAGVNLPTLPSGSTINFAVTCGVTATGQ